MWRSEFVASRVRKGTDLTPCGNVVVVMLTVRGNKRIPRGVEGLVIVQPHIVHLDNNG